MVMIGLSSHKLLSRQALAAQRLPMHTVTTRCTARARGTPRTHQQPHPAPTTAPITAHSPWHTGHWTASRLLQAQPQAPRCGQTNLHQLASPWQTSSVADVLLGSVAAATRQPPATSQRRTPWASMTATATVQCGTARRRRCGHNGPTTSLAVSQGRGPSRQAWTLDADS